MRKVMLFLAVIGLSGALWAADPIVGTWKLNLEKSKPAPGQQATLKEMTVTTIELGTDLETTFNIVGADGTAFSMKFVSPQQGGLVKSEQPAAEGSFVVITLIKPGEMIGTSIQNGKQVEYSHTVVSKDGKTMNRTLKTMDDQGKLVESLMVFDRQ